MKRSNFFVVLLFAALIVTAVFSIVGLQSKLNDLKGDYAELEQLVAEYRDRLDAVEYELECEVDDEYIARIARERFGYHLPGEKIYYFGGYGK